MRSENLHKYEDYKVSNVKSIKGKFGFRITLFYEDGSKKIIQKSGFATKKLANSERDKTLGELITHTFIVDNTLKVCDFLNDWLENVMRPKITYNTYMSYKNAIKHINERIGNTSLALLKASTISKLYKEHFEISASVTKMIRIVLITSLNYAAQMGMIVDNPADKAVFPGKTKHSKTGYRTRKINAKNALTEAQLKKLIIASKDSPIYMHILFAVLLGLRKSEINGLKYTDIDYVNKTITIQRQIGKKLTKSGEALGSSIRDEINTKTLSSNRTLQLPELLFEEILKQRQLYEQQKKRRKSIFHDYGYICCGYNGNPRSRGYVFNRFKQLLEDCGLPNIRWHDLRLSYCSMLLKENFSSKAVSALMGHATEIITVDVYGDNAIIGDCVDVMEEFIAGIFSDKNISINSFDFTDTLEYSSQILKDFMEDFIYEIINFH